MTTNKHAEHRLMETNRRSFLSGILGAGALWCAPRPMAEAQDDRATQNAGGKKRHDAVLRRLKGPMASITIPFAKDFSVDHGSLRGWVDFMCDKNAPVLFLTLGDSELHHLSEEEIEAVIRTVARTADGRALVIGGTGPWWTGQSVKFLRRLADSGVDAVNIHFSPVVRGDEDIYRAFRELNDATTVPLLTYDSSWSVSLITRLAELPNVIGDKCHEQLYRYYDFIRATRDKQFAVLGAGQMRHFLYGYLIGSPAYLCPITPFAPQVGLRFYHALVGNDLDSARDVIYRYEEPLMKATIPLGYPQSYKSLLHLTGHYATNLVRPPRRSHDAAQLAKLRAFLESTGLL